MHDSHEQNERAGEGVSLAELRARIDVLDARLLETLRSRNETVLAIARAKAREGGRPLFDRDRERAVYERIEQGARKIGLAPDLARSLMETVIEGSHRMQEWVAREHARAADDVRPLRMVIVGGAGRMGSRFAAELGARGHAIDVLEPGDPRDPGSVIAEADVTMISVPMEHAELVAAAAGPFVRRDALLCDLNSLKSGICRVMAESSSGEVVGLHPMFGPSVYALRRQKMVYCPVRPGPLAERLRGELASMGMEVVEASPEVHDRAMAVVQVLMHFSTIVMGAALRASGLSLEESLRFTSPIYRLELAFVGRLFAQHPDLYAEIEMTNPHGDVVREAFLEAGAEIASALRRGDRAAFRESFEETAAWFRGFGDEAFALSDRIIDWLVRNP